MIDDFIFFDLDPQSLPRDCEYYFNILVITVAVPVGSLPEAIWEASDISRLKDARPIYLYVYEDEETTEEQIDAYPHCVVEVNTKTDEISWYEMIDFETERPWDIEPIEEDFDYEEGDDDDEGD